MITSGMHNFSICVCGNGIVCPRTGLKKCLAHMDEGYLYADPDFPQLMKNIRNISKRGRKYEAGLCFITHSPVDVLDPQVKRFSEAVIDNSCYKFLFGSDGKGLAETIELFKLSEKEIKLLWKARPEVNAYFAQETSAWSSG